MNKEANRYVNRLGSHSLPHLRHPPRDDAQWWPQPHTTDYELHRCSKQCRLGRLVALLYVLFHFSSTPQPSYNYPFRPSLYRSKLTTIYLDFIDARKWFTGPKITISDVELTEEQQVAIREEGLEIEGLPRPGESSDGEDGVAELKHEKA